MSNGDQALRSPTTHQTERVTEETTGFQPRTVAQALWGTQTGLVQSAIVGAALYKSWPKGVFISKGFTEIQVPE